MRKYFRFQFSGLHRFLSKYPGFSKPEKHSVSFLNAAQFCGALNDNIYKLVLIFYLIQLQGAEHANQILSIAGAVFVIPFLLFSSTAGILADRYSKNRLIISIKTSEICIITLAIFAFVFKISWGSYAILFLLATQSALFSPPKYGIIPEITSKEKVSKANGIIVSFTYLAIIGGTFLASFLTEITNRNYILVGLFCFLVAIAGFLSSFGIKHTPPRGTKKKIDIFFVRQIFHTLIECKDDKHLLLSITGSSYFLLIGSFTQLNIIPFAMESLGYTEVAGGYLFLVTALGIALGAYVAGRASKSEIELGLACCAGVLLAIFFFLLGFSEHRLILSIFSLFLLGYFGGNFIVPFDAFIQLCSPEKIRGRVIAASNFLSFIGVLISSFLLYLFNEVFKFNPAQSFLIMGGITFFVAVFLIIRLSDLFLSYTSKKILHKIYKVNPIHLELVQKTKHPLLMLEEGSFLKAWILAGFIPNLHLLIPQYKTRRFPWFQNFFYSIHRVASPQKFEQLVSYGKQFMHPNIVPCIYLLKKKPVPEKQTFSLPNIFTRTSYEVISVNIEKSTPRNFTIRFSK